MTSISIVQGNWDGEDISMDDNAITKVATWYMAAWNEREVAARHRLLEQCWSDLEQMLGGADGIVPVTYINSAASIKAFCGEHGGVVCTSSNAAATLKWAWERGERILFLPDQHLGRNTAYKMGVPLDRMVVWDPNEIWAASSPTRSRTRA